MVTLLIMTNGRRGYLEETLSSLDKLHGNFTRKLIHDDSGDKEFQDWLKKFNFEIAVTEKVGFTLAMISAWQKLKEDSNEWVFHLEEDFPILEDIYIENMIDVMNNNNHLKQMVLQRRPIEERKLKKRGRVAYYPEYYEDKTDGVNYWIEHRRNFSCNPCLYRKSLIYEYPWTNMKNSEREYSNILLKIPEIKFAFWGKRTDKPRVMHIGEIRSGFNY